MAHRGETSSLIEGIYRSIRRILLPWAPPSSLLFSIDFFVSHDCKHAPHESEAHRPPVFGRFKMSAFPTCRPLRLESEPATRSRQQHVGSLFANGTCVTAAQIPRNQWTCYRCQGALEDQTVIVRFRVVCQRCDRQFLIMCASSRIRYFHFLRRNTFWSWVISL